MTDEIYMFLCATAILSGSLGISLGCVIGYASGKAEGEKEGFQAGFPAGYQRRITDVDREEIRKATATSEEK